MADLEGNESTLPVRLMGADADGKETYAADVSLVEGKRRLETTGLVQIEELFGQDNAADVWFWIGVDDDMGGIGSAGDKIRIQIGAGPISAIYKAIDITYTITAGDVADPEPEIEVAKNIVTMLNSYADFKELWKAQRVADNSVVWIGSKIVGEFGERKAVDDFIVTATQEGGGTTVVTRAFDKIVRRGKSTSLTKDPNDPRMGVLGITGTVAQSVESISQLYTDTLESGAHESGLIEMAVDGSVTPVEYKVHALTDRDIFIQELRFFSISSAVKFGQFLSIASTLTNGILIEIKADDSYIALPTIHATEDFKNKFAIGGTWSLEVQPSASSATSVFRLASPIPIRHIGEFLTDDYVKVTIRDDIDAIASLQMLAFGFTREV